MVANPHRVYVVVDREFGERLGTLAPGVPVWIVDTPANKVVAQRLWKGHPTDSHLRGITTFGVLNSSPPGDLLISQLPAIDLHHGCHSADPAYTLLEVLGTPLSERIKGELSEYGFDEFHSTPAGFRAAHPAPTD
jgi:hypothetical protein